MKHVVVFVRGDEVPRVIGKFDSWELADKFRDEAKAILAKTGGSGWKVWACPVSSKRGWAPLD